MMVASTGTGGSFDASAPSVLFGDVDDVRTDAGITYAADATNGLLVLSGTGQIQGSEPLRVVLHWDRELRRLLPPEP